MILQSLYIYSGSGSVCKGLRLSSLAAFTYHGIEMAIMKSIANQTRPAGAIGIDSADFLHPWPSGSVGR